MLKAVKDLTYTILLVDNMDAMKEFYRNLFPFHIHGEGEDGLSFKPPGSTLFSLRRRTRD